MLLSRLTLSFQVFVIWITSIYSQDSNALLSGSSKAGSSWFNNAIATTLDLTASAANDLINDIDTGVEAAIDLAVLPQEGPSWLRDPLATALDLTASAANDLINDIDTGVEAAIDLAASPQEGPSWLRDPLATALDLTASAANDLINDIDTGVEAAIDFAALPQEELYALARREALAAEEGAHYLTTAIMGNLTFVDRMSSLVEGAENCLVESSVDLPTYVVKKLVRCVTDSVEEPLQLLIDAVGEVQDALELVKQLVHGISDCEDFMCVQNFNVNPVLDVIDVVLHLGLTLTNGTVYVGTITNTVPICLSESITVAPASKLTEMGLSFLRCII